MKSIVVLICVVFLVRDAIQTHLPSSFQKCNRKNDDFNKCLIKAVENGIQQLDKPNKEVGLSSLEPLEIPALVIGAGTSAVGLTQNYKDMKVTGWTKLKCSNVDMNFDKKTLKIECIVPEVVMKFHYQASGKILLLPVYGSGPGTIVLEKLKFTLTFNFKEIEKKGKKHFKVTKSEFLMEPQHIKFNFENLFDGDKALGDNMNKVLNDNWAEIFLDVRSSYEDAYAQIFASMFNNFLGKVSISELFGEE